MLQGVVVQVLGEQVAGPGGGDLVELEALQDLVVVVDLEGEPEVEGDVG